MNWVKQNKGFVGFLVALLAVLIGGTQYVSRSAAAAQKTGKSNRASENFVKDEAVDLDSVTQRERINARLRRSLDGLEEIFGYRLDRDLAEPVNNDPNKLQDALRRVARELQGGTRFPDNLGFPSQVPKKEAIYLAVWRLDVVRHLLRLAKQFGVEEIPAKDGIKLPKYNLIDEKNYLEYAQVEMRMIGSAESLARVLHGVLRPGKYLTLVKALIDYNPLDKRKQRQGRVLPELQLTVAALGLNSKQPLLRRLPEDAVKQASGRFQTYKFR